MRFQLVSTMTSPARPVPRRGYGWLRNIPARRRRQIRAASLGRVAISRATPPDQEEPCPTSPAYTVDLAANPPTAASCSADPFIAYKSSTESVPNVDVSATPATVGALAGFVITFGPLGQVVPSFDGTTTQPATTATVAVGPSSGTGRRYRVTVSANGSVRLCSPDLPVGNSMAC